MKKRRYVLRNIYYPKEYLGEIELDFDNNTGTIFLADSYEGTHPDFLLEVWREQGKTIVSGEDAKYWIHKRVCPPGRHNIRSILEAYGLTEYNASIILAENKGMSDRDDIWFEEIEKGD